MHFKIKNVYHSHMTLSHLNLKLLQVKILLLVATKVQEVPRFRFKLVLSHFVSTNNISMPTPVNDERLRLYLADYDYKEWEVLYKGFLQVFIFPIKMCVFHVLHVIKFQPLIMQL